jgi:predicted lipoprotein with Yx(FWY)xxD motif
VRISIRIAVAALVLTAVAAGAALGAQGRSVAVRAPVVKLKDARFGSILARRDHQALYYWTVEKRDFNVHCTGSCAQAWPPLIVRSRSAVPKRVPGIKGTFGTIRRPDGRLQVTHNRLPLYTYAHERPNQVLCNDVDGWFVVRV